MKKFMEPEVEIVEIQVEDVITTSGETETNPELPDVEDGLGWG